MKSNHGWPIGIGLALLFVWYVGLFGRGFWTPDELREADIAWRMSWQADKAVPLLAGEPFCEKPPLAYWVAAAPIGSFGIQPWAARLPNLLYALLTVISVGLLARALSGPVAGCVAAAAIGTFLLGYQTAIWFATDAPLLAFISLSLLGAYHGFHAAGVKQRLYGYTFMHAALALGFLSKSAFAWLVPALSLATLIVWERRWRELLRWELYAGLVLQAGIILSWVWFVYAGPDGASHLKVFFWNNLAGRFASVEAPAELQYSIGHRNSPGKYLVELPLYLWPWTLLVLAAARRAWRLRGASQADTRAPRFAVAACLPSVLVLSFAATARNVYLAPTLPGFALLVGWWAGQLHQHFDRWDLRALKGSAVLVALAAVLATAVLTVLAFDSSTFAQNPAAWMTLAAAGIGLTLYLAADAWRAGSGEAALPALGSLFFAFASLLIAPAWLAYNQVDRWQNLAVLGAAIKQDTAGHPLILFAADETTQALVDLYVDPRAIQMPSSEPNAYHRLRSDADRDPNMRVLVQLQGRQYSPAVSRLKRLVNADPSHNGVVADLPWLPNAGLRIARQYALPNGRRYAILEPAS